MKQINLSAISAFTTAIVFTTGLSGCQSFIDFTNRNAIEQRKKDQAEEQSKARKELEAQQEIKRKRDDLVGSTEDAVIEIHGAPNRIDQAGSYKIYWYRLTHQLSTTISTKSRGFAYRGSASGSSKSTTEVAEETSFLRFYFKKGLVEKWDERIEN